MKAARTFGALFVLTAVGCLYALMVRDVLVVTALGLLLGAALQPLQAWLCRRHPRLQRLAPALCLAAACLLVLVPLALVLLLCVQTLQSLGADDFQNLHAAWQRASEGPIARLAALFQRLGVYPSGKKVGAIFTQGSEEAVRFAGTQLGRLFASLPQLIINGFLALVTAYFSLRDGQAAKDRLCELLPFPPRRSQEAFDAMRRAVVGVVLSELLVALLQSALALAAMLLCAVPGVFVWTVLCFVLSFLPMIGTTPVTLGCAVYLALVGHMGPAVGMAVAAVVIGSVDNVVRPLLQGSQSQMHPLLVLISVFGGLSTLGAAGIFLGPVVLAVALWSLQTYGRWQRQEGNPAA